MSDLQNKKVSATLMDLLQYPLEIFRNNAEYISLRDKQDQRRRSKDFIIEMTRIMEKFMNLLKPFLPLEFNFEDFNLGRQAKNAASEYEIFSFVLKEFIHFYTTHLYSKNILEQLYAKEHLATVLLLVKLVEQLKQLVEIENDHC